MSTGSKFTRFAGIAVLCVGTLTSAWGATARQRKPKKPAALPPLPSGPTGPVPQMPLDSMAAVPPRVTYQNGQLTIVSPNSTLGDILRAVKKQTGAEIEVPPATERVVTTLGPGPAREVIAELLNGSRFNYVLLGSPEDSSALTRVVLVAKSGPENVVANNPGGQSIQQQPQMIQQANMAPAPEMAAQETNDAEAAAEENADDNNADQQATEAEQQQQQPQGEQPDQPGIKTPQQMLQEMQQRQLQLQQAQPPGQPPIPGSGMPPHPPQEP